MNLLDFPGEILGYITLSADQISRAVMYMTCKGLRAAIHCRIHRKSQLCIAAAATGRIKLFKWAMDHDHTDHGTNIMMVAAKYNHLNLLKWLHSAGYKCDPGICTYAALHNNYKMLKWYLVVNPSLPPPENAVNAAMYKNNFQMVKWLIGKGAPIKYHMAVDYGRLNVIKWMLETPRKFDLDFGFFFGSLLHHAFRGNKFNIIEWCLQTHKHRLEHYDIDIMKQAVAHGKMHTLRIICKDVNEPVRGPCGSRCRREYFYTVDMCKQAAASGRLSILKFMHREGFQWDTTAIRQATDDPRVHDWLDTIG